MSTYRWNNGKKHEGNGMYTLCGLAIPSRGKEWNAFGQADCKRCIKAKAKEEKNQGQ
jgi:hypothetical protein